MAQQRWMRYGLAIAWLCLMSALATAGTPGEGRPVTQTVGSVIQHFVQVAATGNVNIANPGTAVFDGITLPNPSGVTANFPRGDNEAFRLILLWQQATASQNGVYLFNGAGSPMARAVDMDKSEHFKPGTPITVVLGDTYAGHEFFVANNAFPTVDTTAISFIKRATSEPTGAIQLLNATDQIDCGPHNAAHRTITIRSASVTNPVTLTSEPQIAGGRDGQICIIRGEDDTETVTITNGDGFDLKGNDTLTFDSMTIHQFQYVVALNKWLLMSNLAGGGAAVIDLQAVCAQGCEFTGATALTPFSMKDPSSAAKVVIYWAGGIPNLEFLGADGQPMNRTRMINADKYDAIFTGGDECERITGADVHSYSNGCKPTKTIWWAAGSIEPDGTNCHAHEVVTMNSGSKQLLFKCDDSASSIFYGAAQMLNTGWDAGPLTFTLTVYHTSTESITYAGDFQVACRAPGEVSNNTWSAIDANSDADVAITTAHQRPRATTGLLTADGTCAPGDDIFWKYTIDNTNFSANAANAYVFSVGMSYTISTRNGAQE